MSNDTVISLFSGAGGLSLGFSQAGFKPSCAADFDRDACMSYFGSIGLRPHLTDLANPSREFLQNIDELHKPFIIIGGPPCQGFSSAGRKDSSDERNRLVFSYLEIVRRARPRWFLFENVEGLLTSNRGKSVYSLAREFINLGYTIRLCKMNFAAYGLPQARKRVIIVGNRLGVDFSLPSDQFSFNAGKHRRRNGLPPGPTIADAIFPLGRATESETIKARYIRENPESPYDEYLRQGNSQEFSRHVRSCPKSLKEIIPALKQGQSMKDLDESFWPSSYRRRSNRRVRDGTRSESRGGAPHGIARLCADRCCLTITSAAIREFIHPEEDRPLTIRECARLQSFPDSFEFYGNQASAALQIGNAFPPLAANVIASHIAQLDGKSGGQVATENPRLLGWTLTDSTGMSPALADCNRLLESLVVGGSTPNLFEPRKTRSVGAQS